MGLGLFVWGRLRYDLVAALAPWPRSRPASCRPKEAFTGFSDDIVIIVASALLVSAAVARSGVVEPLMRTPRSAPDHVAPVQVVVLVGVVTLLSAFVKNIGALAILMPIAFQLARGTGTSPSCLLMPMAFGSLLGGW